MNAPAWLGLALALSGLPVIMANLLAPSPVFGEHPGMALRRITIGLLVSGMGLYLLV